MAIYHLCIKIISRGKGKSAVAASAYRSGEKIKNEYDGIVHDFTRKGGIAHTEILLPQNAPQEFSDRGTLWNSVEKIEKSKNSQLAREIEIALPKELSREKQINLVREYVKENFVNVGMCADIALHDKNDGNPHCHILLTMRPFNEDKTWGTKSKKEYILDENGEKVKLKNGNYKTRKINTVDWNEQDKAEHWRKAWVDITNKYLEKNSIQEKVDHRSYQRQGIEQIPTIHLGVSATQMEKKGIATDRGNINREIKHQNMILREISRRIKALLNWIRGIGKEEKTLKEVQEQISELQEEKEKYDVKLKQLQNQGKKLEKLANERGRKKRNHRLIQRGLIVERVVENPLIFTNEEIEKLLKVAVHTEEYRKVYDEMINQKDMKDEAEEELIE
ncbi:TPA: MobA/MobL family protein [Streptococcus equi subsp. zooepidemicus]|nr:MobA/MobL family protein [Streptococcus equi subsp. zooepidemicus]HEL0635399.1 MobA/MobL family protein [Streptococcus equi subsp. zooepidemicus]HEL1089569.1 MobA/MobL family protein [Streptococcus equi subsp. zooepidemicus]